MPYLIYLAVFALGFWLGMILMASMAMAGRANQQEEAEAAALLSGPVGINAARLLDIELPPASNLPGDSPMFAGVTWCPQCKAMFRGDLCPGCGP
jgi:hypothetical protein